MIKRITSSIDRLNESVAMVARWIILVVVAEMCYDVCMRYLFSRPTIWSYDISYMLGGTFFMLGLCYVHKLDRHVRVDVFYNMLKPKKKALVDIVMSLVVFFPTFTLLLIYMVPHVITSWQRKERSVVSFWSPPIYPLKTVVLIAIILLWLQSVSNLMKNFEVVMDKGTEEVEK
jgi:TRAP-type mannitol/chloroaromatic compound transport system permease small subunit